ncbi:MAG: cytochrome b/b6 domain-containing protein [Acetobacteraceae bacterium]|nr:cytochrome b/b6 domain-containing protein [Acetobacteraceae bacterium]MDW8399859.1 cytochrome b/b6 domain-containing protein [Acetobacteraceae bacterium]
MAAESYGSVAKWFHWITVGLMAVALPFGFVIKYVKDDAKMAFYAIHESAGLLILFVAIARLAWRLRNPPPPHPADLPKPMRVAATAVHHSLYGAMILQPILGFFMTNAWGFPMRDATAFLGFIHQPAFMAQNVPLAQALQAAHTAVAYAIVALLVLHIAAVVYHQAIRKDGTLLRMV